MRAERRLRELKRDALMQKVRDLQKRKASSKDKAREEWKRRFLEVKKSTPRLEDHCSKLRQELEKLVKDMLVSVKNDADSKPHKPSKKTSYKIMIMRLLQEVEDLRRRLQSVTIRLNAESKLRAQAEFEVKKLRQDLLHKKTQVTLTRKQTAFPQTSEQFFISAV
ncbi:SPATA1_C domain-containing protein [Trichonephila inaurata madagascariensis]|uniref:SPATA1_C domain-containing protein n=1 Tax=Trichonephila inaurata madagascariensis TaxID=2747483 RepID=A0A8X7BYB7_9ARAC|nr:SPATA1_C domain-containing protein [Trichonephila inaurata madagascariensis]